MRVPASLAAVPLVAGAALGIVLAGQGGRLVPQIAAACAVLALVSAFASFVAGDDGGVAAGVVTGCALSAFSLGLSAARDAYHPTMLAWFETLEDRGSHQAVAEGVLRDDAALTEFGATLTLDVRAIVWRDPYGIETLTPVAGGVRLAVGGAGAAGTIGEWRAGRTVRVPAALRLPTVYRNPGTGDERKALARRGVVLLGSVKSAALLEVRQRGSPLDEAAGAARSWTRRVLTRRVGAHAPRSAAVANAILIGDRSGLPAEDERRLQEAGTYHVIAISGGNIAMLTALLIGALRLLQVPPRAAAAATIAVLLFYAELTGAPASVARAVTAAVVYLAGRILDQQGSPLNALAVAALCAVAWAPLSALDAGFILSFSATAGILIGTPRLLRWPERRVRDRRARMVRAAVLAPAALVAASLCAEIVLAPVSASLFSRITMAGLLLNLAAIPLMGVVQGASLATLAVEPISTSAATACGLLAHYAATGLVDSSRLLDIVPWLTRSVAPPAWPLLAAYYAACGAALVAARAGRVAAVMAALVSAIVVVAPAGLTRGAVAPARGLLRLVVLDVGQADATAVVLPDGRALLVDAGGLPRSSYDIGERVVAPALRALGVRRLDELVITHGDPDHIGGAPSMVRHFRPRVVREGVPVPPHDGMRALEALAVSCGASWRITQAGDLDRYGSVEVRVHHPTPPDWERQRVRNDDSVVLELRLGDVSILLPGDIGVQPERAILPRLDVRPLVILKAAHHGSATSSTPEFIDAIRPAAAIVSAGADNAFGHPAALVVNRLRRRGTLMFETRRDGAVFVETDGTSVEIRGWTGRRAVLQRPPPSR